MYSGLLAYRLKTGDLADQVIGFGMAAQQMVSQAVNSVSGSSPAFKAMILMSWCAYDYDNPGEVEPTPGDAISITIVDPDTVECLGDANMFINENVPQGPAYSGLLAFQYKAGPLAESVLGFGVLTEQMRHAAIDTVSGSNPAFKAMALVSWVGYDFDTQEVSPTPVDQVSVTIEDPDTLLCLGDAATFMGVAQPGGGGGTTREIWEDKFGTFLAFEDVYMQFSKTGSIATMTFVYGAQCTLSDTPTAILEFENEFPEAYRPFDLVTFPLFTSTGGGSTNYIGKINIFPSGSIQVVLDASDPSENWPLGINSLQPCSFSYETVAAPAP